LRDRYDQIKALTAEVVVVSFGNKFWVKVWLEQTQAPFPLLLDPERAAYRAYGLAESKRRAWGLRNLLYYARARWQGRAIPPSTGEDTGQLGGDFIIDRQGILRLVHPSRDPTDRPAVEKLLQTLRRM
jgi:peroxiredoxin